MRCAPFASDSDLEFEFFLADRLRMTVGDMRARMSQGEYVHWQAYHGRRAQQAELEQKKAAAKRGR